MTRQRKTSRAYEVFTGEACPKADSSDVFLCQFPRLLMQVPPVVELDELEGLHRHVRLVHRLPANGRCLKSPLSESQQGRKMSVM